MGSQSGAVRSASAQTALSERAPAAIASTTEDIANRLHRRVDLGVTVCERREQALVLARRDVDAALEQAAEEHAVAFGVELREPLDRLVAAPRRRWHPPRRPGPSRTAQAP